MNITSTVALIIINIIAFLVGGYCLIKLTTILKKMFLARLSNVPEILIGEEMWKVSCKMLAIIILILAIYISMVMVYADLIYKMIWE